MLPVSTALLNLIHSLVWILREKGCAMAPSIHGSPALLIAADLEPDHFLDNWGSQGSTFSEERANHWFNWSGVSSHGVWGQKLVQPFRQRIFLYLRRFLSWMYLWFLRNQTACIHLELMSTRTIVSIWDSNISAALARLMQRFLQQFGPSVWTASCLARL